MVIPTNIAPNYNYLAAENAFLRQGMEYKDAVICEQQTTIQHLQKDIESLSKASATFMQERDKFEMDARRWQVMKKIILTQGGERQLYEVQKTIDKELERNRAKGKQ
jgi:hypothetical protein